MKYLLILMLPLLVLAAKKNQPQTGVYQLKKAYTFDQCAEYNAPGGCLTPVKTPVNKDDYFYSDRAFYNSDKDINDWDLGVVINGQNRSIHQKDANYIGEANCKNMRTVYSNALNTLDKSCNQDKDCTEVDLNFNSCRGNLAMTKSDGNLYRVSGLQEMRKKIHNICKWVMPPCPAIPLKLFCNQKTNKCEMREMTRKDYMDVEDPASK